MKKIILAGFGYLGKFIEQQADLTKKKSCINFLGTQTNIVMVLAIM